MGTVYFYQKNGENKVDPKRHGPRIITGRFGNMFDPVYYRWRTIETDSYGILSRNMIFDILFYGRNSDIHFLFSSLAPIRNGILRRNRTNFANADTRLDPNGFLKKRPNRKVARWIGAGRCS